MGQTAILAAIWWVATGCVVAFLFWRFVCFKRQFPNWWVVYKYYSTPRRLRKPPAISPTRDQDEA